MTKIVYKTSKSDAYIINNGLERVKCLEEFDFNQVLILANSTVTDSDIIVITHGLIGNRILYSTCYSRKSEEIKYYDIISKVKDFFPALNKIELICCYNASMKNIKKHHISLSIPDRLRTSSVIIENSMIIDDVTGCINILFSV